jgi:hypothetical protein
MPLDLGLSVEVRSASLDLSVVDLSESGFNWR